MRMKSQTQIVILGLILLFFSGWVLSDWKEGTCGSAFNLWPLATFFYFWIIRIVELQKLDEIMTTKWVQVLMFMVFFPSYTALTIIGFVIFGIALSTDCDSDSSFVFFLVIVFSILRIMMFTMLTILYCQHRRLLRAGSREGHSRLNWEVRNALDFNGRGSYEALNASHRGSGLSND